MRAVIENYVAVRTHFPMNSSVSLKDVLDFLLTLNRVDEHTRQAIKIVQTPYGIDISGASLPEPTDPAEADIEAKLSSCNDANGCGEMLSNLLNTDAVKNDRALAMGIELAIQIVKDGSSTIYSQQYYDKAFDGYYQKTATTGPTQNKKPDAGKGLAGDVSGAKTGSKLCGLPCAVVGAVLGSEGAAYLELDRTVGTVLQTPTS